MLLTGAFVRSLDEKLRLALPKRLREMLGPDQTSFFLTPGTDQSLALYTEQSLTALAARLASAGPAQQDVRTFNRLFYAQAQSVSIDGQGRMRIPPELAKLAGLAHEIMLLGVNDHLEIWDRGRWEAYLAERAPRYDEITERAFAGPKG